MNHNEELRRLMGARLGVPWRSVRIVARTTDHLRRCRLTRRARFVELVAVVGNRAHDTGAFGTRRRWLAARAVLYVREGAETTEALDAVDAAHSPLHGRIGRAKR